MSGRTPFMAQVRAGAGVVLVGVDVLPQPKPVKPGQPAKPAPKEPAPAPQLFADARPLDPLPAAIEAASGLAAFEYGAGRIVQMPVRPKIAYGPGWEVEYDLWQEDRERRGVFVPYVEIGEPIALEGDVRTLALRVSLFDPQGRELARQDGSATPSGKFSFSAEPSMPMLVRVEARLRRT